MPAPSWWRVAIGGFVSGVTLMRAIDNVQAHWAAGSASWRVTTILQLVTVIWFGVQAVHGAIQRVRLHGLHEPESHRNPWEVLDDTRRIRGRSRIAVSVGAVAAAVACFLSGILSLWPAVLIAVAVGAWYRWRPQPRLGPPPDTPLRRTHTS